MSKYNGTLKYFGWFIEEKYLPATKSFINLHGCNFPDVVYSIIGPAYPNDTRANRTSEEIPVFNKLCGPILRLGRLVEYPLQKKKKKTKVGESVFKFYHRVVELESS